MQVKLNHHCPLCNGANHCAIASSGDLQAHCWCKQQEIPLNVLAKIPEYERNQSCICPNCANSFGAKLQSGLA